MALNKIAWIGRFTGPKGELAERILHEVVPQFPQCQFTFIGGATTLAVPTSERQHVQIVSQFITDIRGEINKHDLIIGAGRVAMEAMRCGKPVIAVGERRYVGLIDRSTIDVAKQTNFGDSDWQSDFNLPGLVAELQQILSGQKTVDTQDYPDFLREYDAEFVHQQVMQVYHAAVMDRYLKQFAELPVLIYHRVVDKPLQASRYNIYATRDELDWQLANLSKRGFTTTTFRDLWRGEQPRKPMILTFDDGYQDNYENLLPLLEKHASKAVIFALGDRSLQRNEWDIPSGEPPAALMSDSQLKACHDSGLIEIGSHGLRHAHLPQLDQGALQREIADSKIQLQNVLGAPIYSFAYPYGDYGDREVSAVVQAGYQFAIGTVNGPRQFASDHFRIRRINMFPGTTPGAFRKKTSGYYLRYCKLKGKDF
jgi:peptidoglycan/xylan/chitin deacetylase (PgdA/CDA1 family)